MKNVLLSLGLLGAAIWLLITANPFSKTANLYSGEEKPTAAQISNPMPQNPSPSGYAIGDKAEDFSLKNVDGKMISMASYPEAKGFVVIFTCNGCPYAQLYEQRINDLHKKLEPMGFPVIAINPNDPAVVPDDSFEEMKKLAAAKSYPFAYIFDEGQKIYPKFGATRTPHVFVLDKEKIVRYIGAVDDNAEYPENVKKKYVEMAVEALLAGKKPSPDFTRAVGCSIKKQK